MKPPWLGAMPVGVTTALWEHLAIWGIRSPIKRSGTSFDGGVFRPHPNAGRVRRGRTSSVPTMSVLAGTDFFTAEVLTWRGLVTYYVLFFIHLDTRRVSVAGITEHPDSAWMEQMGRNVTSEGWGFLQDRRYLLHDRDAKFSDSFRDTVIAGGVKPLKLPARSPNLNSFAERWVRSVKEECLSKLVLFGEGSLRRAVGEYVTHFLEERNHQAKETFCCFHRRRKSSAAV
jgi:putative transposase